MALFICIDYTGKIDLFRDVREKNQESVIDLMKSGIGTGHTGIGSAILIGIGTGMGYVIVTGIAKN